jgi:hypothetical protein
MPIMNTYRLAHQLGQQAVGIQHRLCELVLGSIIVVALTELGILRQLGDPVAA